MVRKLTWSKAENVEPERWWGEGQATLAKDHTFISNQDLQLCPVQFYYQEKSGFLLKCYKVTRNEKGKKYFKLSV